jgi:hypothetical protein
MIRNHGQSIASGYSVLIGFLVCLAILAAGPSLRALLLVGIILTLTVPIMLRAMQGHLDFFEPLVLANVALGFMFVGRPIADLLSGQFDHIGYDVRPTFDEALVVALIGSMFMQFGYFSPIGTRMARYIPAPTWRFNPTVLATAAWASLAFGTTLFWMFLQQQGGIELLLLLLGGRRPEDNELYLQSTGYLYNGPLMWAVTALLFFAAAVITRRHRYYFYFIIVSAAFLMYYGAQGTRSNLLYLVVSVPVFWYLWRGRRPRIWALLVAMVVGFSLLGWLREIRNAGGEEDVVVVLTKALASPLTEAADILTGPDAEMFDSLANELIVVPDQLPFQHLATVTDIFVRAVPRPLWPDKPLEANDAVVATLWPMHYSQSRAGPAFSLIGPFYADSGMPTVMFGMFVVGIVFAMLWRWFQRYSNVVTAQLVYSMALPFVLILMRGTIPDTLARALFFVVPLLFLSFIVLLRRRVVSLSRDQRNP